MSRCDSCYSEDFRWYYPAKNFNYSMVDGETYRSLGEWAACETCADLVEKGDREGLVEVSARNHLNGLSILEKELLKNEIRFFHSFFWNNREGKRWKKDDADPAGRRLSGSMVPPGG
jgi:hypothetical protein